MLGSYSTKLRMKNKIKKLIYNYLNFPFPQICRHSVVLDLLNLLETEGWAISEDLARAVCRAWDDEALALLEGGISMQNMQVSDEERKLIEERRAQQVVESFQTSKKQDFTPQEKSERFDRLHDLAKSIFDESVKEQWRDENDSHWCFEAVMELLTPKNQTTKQFWDAFNKLTG